MHIGTSPVSRLRRASVGMVCGMVAMIAGVVLLGYFQKNEAMTGAFSGTLPMHPITAMVLLLGAAGVWLATFEASPYCRRVGLGFSVTLLIIGVMRLGVQLIGLSPEVHRRLSYFFMARMSAEFSHHCQMSPTTYFNFALLGSAMICLYVKRPQFQLPAYCLTAVSALSAIAIISHGLFIDLVPMSASERLFLMSLPAASAILLMAGGIALALSNPARFRTESGAQNQGSSATSKSASLFSKVAISFGSALFTLCGIGIFSYESITEFISDSRWDNHTYRVLAAIDLLHSQLKDAEGADRGFVITGNLKFLEFRREAIGSIQPSITNLQDLLTDNPIEQRRFDLLRPMIQQKIDAVENLTRVRQEMGFDAARKLLSDGPAVQLMQEIEEIIGKMTSDQNNLLRRRTADTETNARRAIALITSGAIVSLALVLGAGWMLNRDIGGRERAEVALRASENMFRGLLQSAPDAMVIADKHCTIHLVNTQAEQLFGYSSEELIGKHVKQIISRHSAQCDSTIPEFNFVPPFVGEMGADRDLFGIRKDGSEFPIEISLSPMETPNGLHVSSAIKDVSRRRRDEQAAEDLNFALRMSNAQLEAANKELESFSYSVSHDLRAPLRSIDGFSLAVLEDYSDKLDPEGQDHLQRVRAASQRMGHLIDDMLNLSRVTRVEISKEQVDLTKVAREIIDELRTGTPDRNVDAVIADGMFAETDPRLIRILMNNLLGNAWKFTAKKSESRIEFGCAGVNGSREFFVKDNGAGFDSTYSNKLFGAFQRLHSTTEFAGTGIGLATVQRIVRRQGGRVRAEGKPDEGATFYFTL